MNLAVTASGDGGYAPWPSAARRPSRIPPPRWARRVVFGLHGRPRARRMEGRGPAPAPERAHGPAESGPWEALTAREGPFRSLLTREAPATAVAA
ncbi:hypothetical protein [Streptomyces sp. NPDC058579]|uniref:hypothetical protein n=1 Tax=Streptomyces sp. NPDC058579 TaxID=3346548 RepID=UPI003647E8CB